MKHKRVKQFLAFSMAIVLALPLNVNAFSYEQEPKSMPLEANEQVQISFEEEYAQINEPLHVRVSGIDLKECSFIWKVDQSVVGYNDTYTPTTEDLEKTISVTVETWGGESYTTSIYFSKLPVVYIDTNDVPIVDKENYVSGTMYIQGNERLNNETTTLYDGNLEIRGRGNSSWEAPKKPYRIKLDKKADLFGMGANKHWTLLANYYDSSQIRNKLSYDFSGELGLTYMSSESVVLFMNGSYQGVYQLCEHIRVGKERIDITDWEGLAEDIADAISNTEKDVDGKELEEYLIEHMEWASTGKVTFAGVTYSLDAYGIELPEIDGGYLMEMDKNLDEVSSFWSSNNQPLMFKAPEYVKTNTEMMSYIKGYVDAFEDAIDTKNGYTVHNGKECHYSELYDIDSLAQYFLVTELFFNVDGMKKSTYLYKDNNDTMKMGPIWDMDWCAGGPIASSTPITKWQTLLYDDEIANEQWYRFLMKDPYFAYKVKNLYDEYRDDIENFISEGGRIDANAQYLKEAALKNDKKWNYGKGFVKDIAELKVWMEERISWLDAQMENLDTLLASWGKYDSTQKDETIISYENVSSSAKSVSVTVNTKSQNPLTVYVNGIKYGEVLPDNGTAEITIPCEEETAFVMTTTEMKGKTYHTFDCVEIENSDVTPPIEQDNPFKDVDKDAYYYDAVLWAVEDQITTGLEKELFGPNETCTRGQIVTFLWRMAGCPENDKDVVCPFVDVAGDAYYYDAVLWAVEKGITKGYTEDTFAPEMTCARGEIVTFLWRYADSPDVETREHPFKDVEENHYYYEAMLWAVEQSITSGYTAVEFAPFHTVTRGETVTFMYRYQE